ncbi:MAG: hypothetical protein RL651_384 [Pseudomonadota bacterium]
MGYAPWLRGASEMAERATIRAVGEVAEWSNVPDSKSGVLKGTVGSNPTLSAKLLHNPLIWRVFCCPLLSLAQA